MGKILVLAVDRDDDFGAKGGVTTPVVGVERCKEAATALAMADPEDSDMNALFAAIKVCLDLRAEGTDAEVALICGDSKVGIKSDMAISKEFETVKKQIANLRSRQVLDREGSDKNGYWVVLIRK